MSGGISAAVYGLAHQSRALCNVPANNSESHLFLVGTCNPSLRRNEISVLRYDEDAHVVRCDGVFEIEQQVWSMCGSPRDPESVLVVRNDARNNQSAALAKVPLTQQHAANAEDLSVEIVGALPVAAAGGSAGAAQLQQTTIWDASYHPTNADICATVSGAGIVSIFSASTLALLSRIDCPAARSMSWAPSSSDVLAVGSADGYARVFDLRSPGGAEASPPSMNIISSGGSGAGNINTPKLTIDLRSQAARCRQVRFNPNVPGNALVLATGSDDGKVHIFDLRNALQPAASSTATAAATAAVASMTQPSASLSGHSHWITQIQFNPFHDEFILTASTDSFVNLWRVGSLSAASRDAAALPDALVAKIDEHEDSVYCVAWSALGPWVFASLSIDGRVLLHQIPHDAKMQALLSSA